jgi:hypothetical protein
MNITTAIKLDSELMIKVNADYDYCLGDRVTQACENCEINSIKSSTGRKVSIEAVARHEGRSVEWIEETIREQIIEDSIMEHHIDY